MSTLRSSSGDGTTAPVPAGPAVPDALVPPAISVVIACHNAGAYVATAIQSALDQVPPPSEVVVCDDASTDDSAHVLETFGPRIRVVRLPDNGGEAVAKNTAIRAARSAFVAVLDADDEWLPGRLAAVQDLLRRDPALDVVTTDAFLVYDGRVLGRWYASHYPFERGDQRRGILARNFVFGHVVVRRSAFLAVGGFDESLRHATDWDCWIRMVHAGHRIGLVEEPLARYRLHEQSLSSDRSAMARGIVDLLARNLRALSLTPEERATGEQALAEQRRTQDRSNLKQALLRGRTSAARRAAEAVILNHHQPRRSRAMAVGAWLAPELVARRHRHREATTWLGPGDVRLPRTSPPRRTQLLVTLPDRPWPADGGKRMRSANTLRALAAMPDVDVDVAILFAGPPLADPLPPGVSVRTCVQIDALPRRKPSGIVAVIARAVPWQVAVTRWGVARRDMAPFRRTPYDVVWFGSSDHALSLHRSLHARRKIVDMDDVETSKLRRFLSLRPDTRSTRGLVRWQRRVELPLWHAVERRVRSLADALVVCSELDRHRIGGDRTHVVPNTYPIPQASSGFGRSGATVLVVGTYHYPPNVDAAVYAAQRVLPLLQRRVPEATLRLVGRGGRDLLDDVANLRGVEVVGDVDDVGPELKGASVVLVPVRYGGGTRIKVIEAFAHQIPVVTTSLGCEGLNVIPGEHALVADDADGLAEACARILRDEGLATHLVAAARQLYDEHFHPQRAEDAVVRVLHSVLPEVPRHDTGSAVPPAS